MNVQAFLDKLASEPQSIEFTDTMDVIEQTYRYQPTRFSNGEVVNEAGQNEGSCKLFAFARLQNLDKDQTLACFGHYYRNDVLGNPDGSDHANIRQFMQSGWNGIQFDGEPLITA